jgi:DNA-binding PadR family transcriptional regulator
MDGMLSSADREIRLGIWKIHILHHAAAGPVWGTWLLEELAAHGYRLSPGTLYPALARMEKNGWIRRTKGGRHARARQDIRITPEGRHLLKLLRREVSELHQEVVLQREPGTPPPGIGGRKPETTRGRPARARNDDKKRTK